MSQHGGKRPGAGRPKGSRTKTTRLDQQNMILRSQELSGMALDTVADIARNGTIERNRLAAAVHLLDRAFGKPVQMQLIEDPEKDAELMKLAEELRAVTRGSSPFLIATERQKMQLAASKKTEEGTS